MSCDPKQGIDEEVAKKVVDVASHWDMTDITSNDQGKGLDMEVDSIGEMESVRDDSSNENSSSHSNNGFD